MAPSERLHTARCVSTIIRNSTSSSIKKTIFLIASCLLEHAGTAPHEAAGPPQHFVIDVHVDDKVLRPSSQRAPVSASAGTSLSALACGLEQGCARLRGGSPGADALGENAWAQRLTAWEGEDNAMSMHDEDEHDGLEQPHGAAGQSQLSQPISSESVVATESEEPVPAAPILPTMEVEGVAMAVAGVRLAADDAVLERARRASVIQELLGMGADIRRAGRVPPPFCTCVSPACRPVF